MGLEGRERREWVVVRVERRVESWFRR